MVNINVQPTPNVQKRLNIISDCVKDDTFKFLYNGNCVKECPEDTVSVNNVCKEKSEDLCSLSELNLENLDTTNEHYIEDLAKEYAEEHTNSSHHISYYSNSDSDLMLFKKSECIIDITVHMNNINFDECYNKVKTNYKINDDLIIGVIQRHKLTHPTTSFAVFNPYSGEELSIQDICMNDTLIIEKDLESAS